MIPLKSDEFLLVKGSTGVIGIVKAGDKNQFFIETEKEEIILSLEPEDIIVASGFGTDETLINGIKCILFTIRELGSPLIVLPKNHPATKKLRVVVSAGNITRISCRITPGTHPEQDILCGSPEFDGVQILGVKGGVELRNLPNAAIERKPFGV